MKKPRCGSFRILRTELQNGKVGSDSVASKGGCLRLCGIELVAGLSSMAMASFDTSTGAAFMIRVERT